MINRQSLPDRYSIRSVDACLAEVGHAQSKVFSTLDLSNSFWQLPLAEESRNYSAFTVFGAGQWRFKVGAQGLAGCPATFSRLMDAVVKDLPFCLSYIDDSLVHSKDLTSHCQHLKAVFERFRHNNLKANLRKCLFGTGEVQYLGHTLTSGGITPGKDKTQVLRELLPPTTRTTLKSFLGLANFFRSYIRGYAKMSAPLHKLCSNKADWKGGPLPPVELKAFQLLRHALTSAPVLALPSREGQFHLYVDGALGSLDGTRGQSGLGAALLQDQADGSRRPVAFASRQLTDHERNYSAHLLELTACCYGIEHYATYLRGRPFVLYSDHLPLTRLSKVHSKTLSRLEEKLQ